MIGYLDVAVDDLHLVQVKNCARDLVEERLHRELDVQLVRLRSEDPFEKISAFHKLEEHVVALRDFSHFQDPHDVGLKNFKRSFETITFTLLYRDIGFTVLYHTIR